MTRTFEQEKELLWNLRKEIKLGSIYTQDYACSYNIKPDTVYDFFDGYISYLDELAQEDKFGYDDAFDLYDRYDNADNLYDWFGCFEEDPLGIISASEEDPDKDLPKALEAVLDIIRNDGSIYADYCVQPAHHIYNVRTKDMLIIERPEDIEKIENALCPMYFCFISSTDSPGDGEMLGEICDWGYSDEYGSCSSCGCPIEFDDGQYIDYEGERICFDCLDDDMYFHEYLANEPHHANTKYCQKELENKGFVLVDNDLSSGYYPHNTDDPEKTMQKALEREPNGEFIFSIVSGNPFEVKYQLYKYVG